ncbi:MAG: CDP-alcohol phosphatidyltransferase family protein [Pseudomonadota bacterium]|nr:CDP-alcohol phosphatidyltransferase family protein [Pseudomonadota bacterium]
MAAKEEKERVISVILTPDTEGTKKVFGIPTARRLALLSKQTGSDEIHIVGRMDPFRGMLADLTTPEGFHPAEDREGLDGAAAAILARHPAPEAGKVLVMRADLVVDKATLQKAARTGAGPRSPGDGGAGNGARIFPASPQNLAAVMKQAWAYNGDDPRSEPSALREANGLPGRPHGGEDIRAAERRLIDAIRAQTRDTDGFMSRHLSRHISLLMSTRLALTPVTPNQVTLAGAGIGLLGALFIAQGGYWNQLAGCLLFLFCIIIDGVDGEIARLKLQESEFGHKLDIVTDNIVHVAIFSGLAVGYYRQTGDHLYIQLLGVLLGGFALCGVAVYLRLLKPGAGAFRSPALGRLLTLMSNRDFAYLMVLLALAGRLHWFLIGAAYGSYVFALSLWLATGAGRRTPAAASGGPGMRTRGADNG